jgi:hypothetical protein
MLQRQTVRFSAAFSRLPPDIAFFGAPYLIIYRDGVACDRH